MVQKLIKYITTHFAGLLVEQEFTDKTGNKHVKYYVGGEIADKHMTALAPFANLYIPMKDGKVRQLRLLSTGEPYKNKFGMMVPAISNNISLAPDTRDYVDADKTADLFA
tara:strand:+ start:3801 stop:4130 length:330 start_codon:yes stop_codon:yes gene_type:complete